MFAACGPKGVAIAARTHRRRVHAGQTFTYSVKISSTNGKADLDLEGLALNVVLPEGARYSKGKAKSRAAYPAPVVINNTVTWPLSSSAKAVFLMKVMTYHTATLPSLTLTAYVAQISGQAVPICPLYAKNVTVQVIHKKKLK